MLMVGYHTVLRGGWCDIIVLSLIMDERIV